MGPAVLRRILPTVAFATIALSIVGSAHYYLVRRLVLDPEWPSPIREIAIGTITVLGLSLVGYFVAERMLRPPWLRIATWPPALWMGFAFLCLVLLGFSDAMSLLIAAPSSPNVVTSRALAAMIVAGIFTVLGAPRALRPPAVQRVEIELARWPRALDGYRIVQISDIHIGPLLGRKFASGVVRKVNELAADLVAVTGDLVDGSTAALRDDVAPFGELAAADGVFFVTGNHDYYSNARAWVEEVQRLGLTPLRNARVRIERGGGAFDLAGVEDHRAHQVDPSWRSDIDAALDGRASDDPTPVVLLAHDPTTFSSASRRGVDLQLSGHTHGGQIWPFVYLVRLVVPWVAGLYTVGASSLYVSRGTGFWGPPLRVGAPAEITEIVLRSPPEGTP